MTLRYPFLFRSRVVFCKFLPSSGIMRARAATPGTPPRMPMMRAVLKWLLVAWVIPVSVAAGQRQSDLLPMLLQGIKANYAGNYDLAEDIFNRVGEKAPDYPAADFYQATVLFWRGSVDHSSPEYDAQIRLRLEGAIQKAQALLDNNPDDIEALHYIGLAYTYLGRLDAHRGRYYKGGVKGETGRKYLEKAIRLCEGESRGKQPPDCTVCEDLYFPYGAYIYFAGRLPRFVKWFDFLWFIPSGSSADGLRALERARSNSCLHNLGAVNLLSSIYAFFETGTITEALALSRELITAYPDNPHLDLKHARILLTAGQFQEASRYAASVADKAQSGKPNYDKITWLGARLIIAESDLYQGKRGRFNDTIAALEADPDLRGNTLSSYIDLLKGMAADIDGDRDAAMAHYETAVAYKGPQRNPYVVRKAKRYLENAFSPAQR